MSPRRHNQKASWEVDADKPKPEGETRVRRSYCVKDLVESPAPGIENLHDIVVYAARTHGDKPALSHRPTLRTTTESKVIKRRGPDGKEVEETKEWTFYHMGSFESMSYTELLQRVRWVGSGLAELGVGGQGETMFNIYGQTSVNWQLVAQSCAFQAVTICTAYDSLGPSGLAHSLFEPGVRSMFTNADLLPTLLKVIGDCPTVRLVIYDGEADEGVLQRLAEKREGLRIVKLDEVEELGKAKIREAVKAKPEDILCVMYTSGSTGTPKGVILTHRNVIAAIGAVWHLLNEFLEPVDTYLAFLPLAHILEFVVEASWIYAGISIGYGRIKTLTDASVKDCKGDIAEFRPSIMVGVPAVWESIRKGIQVKVDKSGGAKKAIFNGALGAKQFARNWHVPGLAGLTDKVVFNAVKAQTGGRLKIALSGGGSLSADTQQFVNNSVTQLIQGYGLTETVGMCAVLHPSWYAYGVAGCPMPSMEIKLVDTKEAGYLSTNTLPQGEIYLRGPSVTNGYFKRPDLDAESFTSDGWFKTGDVGQFNADGTLSIVDRLKNLVKLSDGEYIAVERLESIYKSNTLVANGCLLANPLHRQPAMIVVVHPQNIVAFAKSKGLSETSAEMLCSSKEAHQAVLKELNKTGKENGFKTMELLEAVILTDDEWTPQSGLLTAASKLMRKAIEQRYAAEIKEVYA